MSDSPIAKLPVEILGEILQNLDVKTVKNCRLVSKQFSEGVDTNRIYLRKKSIDHCSIYDWDDRIRLAVTHEISGSTTVWRCVMKTQTGFTAWTADRFRDYFLHDGLRDPYKYVGENAPVRTFAQGLKDHLGFICKHVNVDYLQVDSLSAATAAVLANVIRSHRTPNSAPFARHIYMTLCLEEDLEEAHARFVRATGVKVLSVKSLCREDKPDKGLIFKAISSVKCLEQIDIDWDPLNDTDRSTIKDTGSVVEDEYLLATRATVIRGLPKFRITGIISLFREACNGERRIDNVQATLHFPEPAPITLPGKASILNRAFAFGIGNYTSLARNDYVQWIVRDNQDVQLLDVRFKSVRNQLIIKNL